ncbi:MAG TPA: response regulator [Streptosporangiaceae bacterium]
MQLRCLIVDDNAAFIEMASIVLEREGVMVAGTASSIADALRKVDELRPDVVLVDIMLGDENGLDLASRLAGNGMGGMAVIMTSTWAGPDYVDLIAGSPAAGFLPKTELSAAGIRKILAR